MNFFQGIIFIFSNTVHNITGLFILNVNVQLRVEIDLCLKWRYQLLDVRPYPCLSVHPQPQNPVAESINFYCLNIQTF